MTETNRDQITRLASSAGCVDFTIHTGDGHPSSGAVGVTTFVDATGVVRALTATATQVKAMSGDSAGWATLTVSAGTVDSWDLAARTCGV